MGNINTFIYCLQADTIQSPEGQAVNANAILTAITPEFIPGAFSFSIVFALNNLEIENHTLHIYFKNSDGKVLVDSNDIHIPFKEIIEKGQNGASLPDEEKGMIMSMDLRNVLFEKVGYYCTFIYLDGNLVGEYKIYAKGKNRI